MLRAIEGDWTSAGGGAGDWTRQAGEAGYAVGIDAGVTGITAGLVDTGTGVVLRRLSAASPSDSEAALAVCVELAAELATHPVAAVGVAVPEIVHRAGTVETAFNWDWRHVDVRRHFASIAHATVQVDVRAAAVGEARVGAGRGLECFVHVIIDTGIAAVVVRHGAPWDGRCGAALVLGVPPVEEVAGGAAFAAFGDVDEVLDSPGYASVVGEAAARLGEEMARVVNVIDPDAVIVGGRLGLHPGYRRQWVDVMRRAIWYRPTALVPVVAAELHADAVLVGAALHAAAAVPTV